MFLPTVSQQYANGTQKNSKATWPYSRVIMMPYGRDEARVHPADAMAMFLARERLASSNLFYNAASTQRVTHSLLVVVENVQVRD